MPILSKTDALTIKPLKQSRCDRSNLLQNANSCARDHDTKKGLNITISFIKNFSQFYFLRYYSAVHNSGATLRNFSIFLFQAIFIHSYELCIYMLYIFVKGMLQVI